MIIHKKTPLYLIVVAAGSGTRMGGSVPKQFISLWGLPILMHSILAFTRWNKNIGVVVVLPPREIEFWKNLCSKHQFDIPHQIVEGGATRFESVRQGLETLSGEGIVAIHDGVRPLIDAHTIRRCFVGADEQGSAIPVVAMVDSVRQLTNTGSVVFDRASLRCVQTPQVFRLPLIKQAYLQAEHSSHTDDASVFETAGHSVHLVEGDRANIKITSHFDLRLAEAVMSHRSSQEEEEALL